MGSGPSTTQGRPHNRPLPATVLLALVVLSGRLAAQPTPDWLTGPALQQQLAAKVSINWQGTPLRRGLADLARLHRVCLLADRRLDPDRPLQATITDVPLADALQQVAVALDAGYVQLGPVGYFGPVAATDRLRTLIALRKDDAANLPFAQRAALVASAALHWDDLAEPRQLIEQLGAEARVRIMGLERVPHDLWGAADLPALGWTERLSLLAGEFDLTFRLAADGRTLTLVPAPEAVAIERDYPAGASALETAKRYALLAPRATVSAEGKKVVVRGRIEDHERIAAAGKPGATEVKPGGKIVKNLYTLRFDNAPLAKVLPVLETRLGVKISVDNAAVARAGIVMSKPVSINVDRASLDEVFTALLTPAGLTFRRTDLKIEIYPAK